MHHYNLQFLGLLLFAFDSASAQTRDSIYRVDIRYSHGKYDFKYKGMRSSEEFISFRREMDSFIIYKYYSVQKLADQGKLVHADTTYYSVWGVIGKGKYLKR